MKTLIIAFALIVVSVSAYAGKKPTIELSGTFALAEGPESCPKQLQITQLKPTHIVLVGDTPDIGGGRHYAYINEGVKKYNDDFGTSTQEKTELKIENGEKVIREYSRACGGLIFVKCHEWTLNSALIQHNENQITAQTPQYPNSYDYSGLDANTSCSYQKIAN